MGPNDWVGQVTETCSDVNKVSGRIIVRVDLAQVALEFELEQLDEMPDPSVANARRQQTVEFWVDE